LETRIDTNDTDAEQAVVTCILDIPTHGKRTEGMDLLHRFLGRQPVLNRSGEIVSYEMCINKPNPPPGKGAPLLQQMTDEMLLSSMEELDLQKMRGGKPIFATLSSSASLNTAFLDRLEGTGIVLMFTPPPAEPLAALTARCQALHKHGYRFGLELPEYREALDDLLPLVDTIRIDTTPYDAAQLGEIAVSIKNHGDFQLIANEVESEEGYAICHKLGFHLFQGNFLTKLLQGRAKTAKTIDSQRLHVMQLLNQTMNHAGISELEKRFKRDPMLSYKLLRILNSPATGLLQPLRSLTHALVVLGYDQLYRWLTLLLFASGQPDQRTLALMHQALVRARLTELLGRKKLKPHEQDGLFITGIFSLLDVLLDMPMEAALKNLKLPPPVAAALLKREGIYALFLDLAIACEEAEEHVIATYAATSGISAEEINIAHVQALIWAEEAGWGELNAAA